MRGGKRENAGRKIGASTILAAEMKRRLVERLEKEWDPIVDMAVKQAKRGDGKARDWLSIRAMGVPAYTDENGNEFVPTMIVVKCNGDKGNQPTPQTI